MYDPGKYDRLYRDDPSNADVCDICGRSEDHKHEWDEYGFPIWPDESSDG